MEQKALNAAYIECQGAFLYVFVSYIITEKLQGKFLLAGPNHHL
jgi:hypothetical protein